MLVHEDNGQKTFVLVFESGDEVMSTLTDFAHVNKLAGSHFTAIGAFRDVVVGYFDWDMKDYKRLHFLEQMEVVSLIGDVALGEKGEPKVHAHVVLGRADGTARAGHLLEAHVRPTLELTLVESPKYLRRRHDSASGLALIRI